MNGKIFGRYELLDRVAVGGMAEVYRAKAKGAVGFERTVAVKRILPGYSQDREFVAMFIDEAKIACELSHGNICQIYDLGEVESRYFIAMEFIDGRDVRCILEELAKQKRPSKIPPALAAYIAAEACTGLDYAHRKLDKNGRPMGIVHRDISPSNILVSFEGEVKIGDFGIAKAAEKLSRTRTGTIKGKYNYLSPEAVRGLGVDNRSDIFGMGAVLYEMLIGKKVFDARSELRILELVRSGEYTPARQLDSSVPRELDQIINKALMRDRDKRYQRADEMVYDLHGFLYGLRKRTSGAEMSAFMRELFGDQQTAVVSSPGIQQLPSAPSDSFEETLEADSARQQSTERRSSLTDPGIDADDQTGLDGPHNQRTLPPPGAPGAPNVREERTAIVSLPGRAEAEEPEGVREQNTAIVSNPLVEDAERRADGDDLPSQPTQIRATPEDENADPVAPILPFSQWNTRQRTEAAIAVAFGLLWLGLSLRGGFL